MESAEIFFYFLNSFSRKIIKKSLFSVWISEFVTSKKIIKRITGEKDVSLK
jgi:hypothetical protein